MQSNQWLSSALLILAGPLYGAAPTLVTTIPIPSSAITAVAANPVTNRVYVVDEGNNQALILDGTTNAITASITPAYGAQPLYAAVNKARNQYVLATGNTGAVFDGATNTPIVNINGNSSVVGTSAFTAMSENEVTNKLYSTNLGSIVVTDLSTGSMGILGIPFLKTGEICTVRGLTVNSSLNWVYALTQCQLASAVVFIFDGTSGAILNTVDLGGSIPIGADVVEIALNAKSNKLYVAN